MKKSFIVHPFLLAVFPVLFLFSHNIEAVSYSEIFLPSLISLGFTLLLVLLLSLVIKDDKKAGIVVSLFLILFFFYGHLFDMLQSWSHRYLMPVVGILFICGTYFIINTRRDLGNFTGILNSVAFCLLAISVINIVGYEVRTKDIWLDRGSSSQQQKMDAGISGNKATLRDIYYIILDGYASFSTLKQVYGYDNYEFTDFLAKKGFYVASASTSNYAMSFLSLASSLNMEYLNYIADEMTEDSTSKSAVYKMLQDYKIWRVLKSKGYKFIHLQSLWAPAEKNKYADVQIRCGISRFLSTLLYKTTALRAPYDIFFKYSDIRKGILDSFDKLAEVAETEGPKFIFAHIFCPHPPFVFGRDGEPANYAGRDDRDERARYLAQLIFVSKKVKLLVDNILSTSKMAPIIVLQADHGPALDFTLPDNQGWDRPSASMLKERMRIFNAYYLPAGGSNLLYNSITPVNTFRVVFNHYFDAHYELLSDRSYYSNYEHPYKFIEVTNILFER